MKFRILMIMVWLLLAATSSCAQDYWSCYRSRDKNGSNIVFVDSAKNVMLTVPCDQGTTFGINAIATSVYKQSEGGWLVNREGRRVSKMYGEEYSEFHVNYPHVFCLAKRLTTRLFLWGVVDEYENIIVPFRYEYVEARDDYMRAVDSEGRETLYDYHGHRYHKNRLCHKKPKYSTLPWKRTEDKRYVLLNEKGEVVSDTFDAVINCEMHVERLLYRVANQRGRKIDRGIVGKTGKTIVPAQYKEVAYLTYADCCQNYFAYGHDGLTDIYSLDGVCWASRISSIDYLSDRSILLGRSGTDDYVLDLDRHVAIRMDSLKCPYQVLWRQAKKGCIHVMKTDGTIGYIDYYGNEVSDFLVPHEKVDIIINRSLLSR